MAVSRTSWFITSALALAVAALGLAELHGLLPGSTFPGSPTVEAAFVIACAVPVALTRAYPISALLAEAVVETIWQYTLYDETTQLPFTPFVATLVVVFGAGAFTWGRRAHVADALIGLAVLSGVVDAIAGKPLDQTIPSLLNMIGVFVLGRLLRNYRAHAQAAADRAEQIMRATEAERRAAVAEERARIARELHDVISHDVSLMVLQASVERRLLGEHDPRADVLTTIEATGRDALTELRRMLGVLRQESDTDTPAAPLAPQPGLADLALLVEQARCAGLDVDLDVESEPGALPAGLDLTAYRVVQESLTNVAKHVGQTHVAISVRHTPAELRISIVDEGPPPDVPVSGPGDATRPGHGLVGMKERVAVYGGDLQSGPWHGGFRVIARLPLAGTT